VTEARHDGHFEVLRRPVGVLPGYDETWIEHPRPEVPQRAFSDITGERLGLTVANRGLPEVEVRRREDGGTEIAVTLLRCVGWLSRDDFSTRKGHAGPPSVATPMAQMAGQWSFDYAIIPHQAGEILAAWQQAYAFETPLRAVSATLHEGTLPGSASFVEVEPAEFVISAVKAAETGNGWLVRGYNLENTERIVRIKPWRLFQQAWRVNLAEEKQEQLVVGGNGCVTFTAKGHEIVSVMFSQE
jgi:alpha-mannosidase